MNTPSPVDFRCYLITDRTRTGGRPLATALQAAAHAGIKAVQIREKDLTPRELFALAIEVRDALKSLGTRVLINDRADIACAAELAGVHLTTTSLSPKSARCCLRAGSLVGVSCHTLVEARFAEEFGADFITFSPVFFTPSKAAYGEPRGLEALREVCAAVRLPVFALGGITPDRVPACLDAGAHGIAAISALLDVPSIEEAVGAFANALGGL
ncbi:MAG: thiamine phosphate synthase [Armatimonadota bacterium]